MITLGIVERGRDRCVKILVYWCKNICAKKKEKIEN